MKLFTRYNRINLVATVVIFVLSAVSFFFLLRFILVGQLDEDLKIEQHEIENYADKYQRLPEIIPVRDQHTTYAPIDHDGGRAKFKTLKDHDAGEREEEVSRRLIFYIQVQSQWYEITVSKSLEGTDTMIKSIATIALITILLILFISVIINRILLKKLWQPFYESLDSIRRFEIGKKNTLQLPATSIEEFTAMNETLKSALTKANEDYQHLKEFTENASHELQTPLAIIRSKLDVLIQDENMSEPQSKNVQGAYDAIQRLSRLNQGLLLLTKIENGQYADTAIINLQQKINEKIIQFKEMVQAKNITVTTNLDAEASLQMNPVLADIILNNLLSNAIKYNVPGGCIKIAADNDRLEISNSAATGALDETRLFRRFAKPGYDKEEGIGLGLAIVRQAAAFGNFNTRYYYDNHFHHFLLTK